MECTVDIYTDYLISSTGQVSATGLSRLYEGAISHDQVTRMLTNQYLDRGYACIQYESLGAPDRAGRFSLRLCLL